MIREIVSTETIPAQAACEVEHREFQCGVCEATFAYKEDAEEHYGQKHTVKEERAIGSRRFVRFETEEDFRCWHEYVEGYENVYVGEWNGPGWYHAFSGSERCSRGCCTQCYLKTEPAVYTVIDLRQEAEQLLGRAAEINRELGLDYYAYDEE